jgi:DsbC/DsbD-like thiol-disulfide interchange protein
MRRSIKLCLTATLALAAGSYAVSAPQSAPNIGVNGYFSSDKAQRGRTIQAAVVMEIPSGYHVNSNHPLDQYLIATQLRIEAPPGIKVGPILYPRAALRAFKFSESKMSVYEGRTILRFNLTVPAGFAAGSVELKAHLRYQSCNEEVCFPPQTREVSLPIDVVGRNDRVQPTNLGFFGGR